MHISGSINNNLRGFQYWQKYCLNLRYNKKTSGWLLHQPVQIFFYSLSVIGSILARNFESCRGQHFSAQIHSQLPSGIFCHYFWLLSVDARISYFTYVMFRFSSKIQFCAIQERSFAFMNTFQKAGVEAVRFSAGILQRCAELCISEARGLSFKAWTRWIGHVLVPRDQRPIIDQSWRRHAREHRIFRQNCLRLCHG